jgi:hypothetical protein
MDDKVYDEPTQVDAEDGKVVLDGPDGVAVLMTPEAALETSDRLLTGASQAKGQQIQEAQRRQAREGIGIPDNGAPEPGSNGPESAA